MFTGNILAGSDIIPDHISGFTTKYNTGSYRSIPCLQMPSKNHIYFVFNRGGMDSDIVQIVIKASNL